MDFAFFITRRIAFSGEKSFSRFIIRIAVAAVALSLAVMIVASSLVEGFQRAIAGKVYDFFGHIHVSKYGDRESHDRPVMIEKAVYDDIASAPAVRHVQIFAHKAGIIKKKSDLEGIVLKGVGDDFDWEHFRRFIVEGNDLRTRDTAVSRGILISQATANRMQYNVGDKVNLHFFDARSGSLLDARSRFLDFSITGIYKTGLEEFDKVFALIDIKEIRRLNEWNENEVGGYEVFLEDSPQPANLFSSRAETRFWKNHAESVAWAAGPFLHVESIKEVYPTIFDWINLQRINERIILILMVVVAIINMTTSLLILILERTGMIGVLKALGAGSRTIRRIFLFNAAWIIGKGLFWGNLLGIGLCVVQQQFGLLRLPEASYYISVAPVALNFAWIALLNIATIAVCLLFLILPSYLIAGIKPIRAIRFA